MLQLKNISKAYGPRELFSGVNSSINPGEKIGLTGRNGSGKSTLFDIITGKTPPDSGEVSFPGGYVIGYLRQEHIFSGSDIVSEAGSALPSRARHEIWKARKILAGLGFSPESFSSPPGTLSGGMRLRLSLAKAILSEPDLLLLDEPGNFLDILSLRWITGFLRSWKGSLMLISHDRGFMDSITTHTMMIHRKKIRKFSGDTAKAFGRIRQEEEVHEKTRVNYEKKKEQTLEYINRFRAKARLAKSVQSAVKALEKQEKLVKLEKFRTLDFSFSALPLEAPAVMRVNSVSFSYNPDEPLIENFSLEIGSRDRVCVTGRNGSGKTTLLKILSGEIKPRSGEIKTHPEAVIGRYLESDTAALRPDNTVLREVSSGARITQQQARDICGTLIFEGDSALKRISVLSGGEKSRVLIGKLLARPCNLLILDEPTSHLDLESCEALADAIEKFEGAVLLVSHNEGLLERVSNRMVIFSGSRIRVFEGSYSDFLEREGWEEEREEPSPSPSPSTAPDRSTIRRLQAELRQERFRKLRPLEDKTGECQEKIALLEEERDSNTRNLIEASRNGDSGKIAELSARDSELSGRIDELYIRLQELLDEHEELSSSFNDRLNELDPEEEKSNL